VRLYESVRKLDEKLRLPVILRYVNGYTAQETAQILKLPYRSVLKRLKQAKEILKKELREVDA